MYGFATFIYGDIYLIVDQDDSFVIMPPILLFLSLMATLLSSLTNYIDCGTGSQAAFSHVLASFNSA